MADWYYAKNGQQQGPVNSAQLKQMASSGQIGPDDLVFREGGTQWVAASTVAGLQFGGGSAPPPGPVSPTRSAAPPSRSSKRDDLDDVGELPRDDRPRRRSGGEGGIVDMILFRAFITPSVIAIVFWIGMLGFLGYGALALYGGIQVMQFSSSHGLFMIMLGLGTITIGGLYWRVVCEIITVVFRIFETLKDVHKELKKANDK